MKIKKLKTLADFKNKKILFSDEVLEALYNVDNRFTFSKEDINLLKQKGHSLYISDQEEFKKDGCGDKFQWVSSLTFDGDGFYVEVEDENN